MRGKGGMEYRVLGPLEVRDEGRLVPLHGAKQRGLLAVLLVKHRSWLRRDQVADALWPGEAVRKNTVQVLVSRLRHALGPHAQLRSDQDRYRLEGIDHLDAALFGELCASARRALDDRHHEAAAAALEEALALWRGPAFADVDNIVAVDNRARRLTMLRHDAEEDWATASLLLGRHHTVVNETIDLARAQPLREARWETAMLALYRCGRQAEALRTFQEAQSLLRDGLGIEPSLALRSLEVRILNQAPDLLQDTPIGPAEQPNGTWPHYPNSFVGRQAELHATDTALQPGALVTLTGPGGVGKSRLGVTAAHSASTRFTDGAWFVDLAAIHTDTDVAAQLGHALGLVDTRANIDWTDAVVTHLAQRNTLVLLDNCEHVLAGAGNLADAIVDHCPEVTLLATSRHALPSPSQHVLAVHPLPLPPDADTPFHHLADNPSVQLLVDRIRAVDPLCQLTESNAAALASLARVLDGVPLAIELAAARSRSLSVHQLAERLADQLGTLRSLTASNPRHHSVDSATNWTYELLTPPAQLLFCRLGVFPAWFTLEAVEAVCAEDKGASTLAAIHVPHVLDDLVAHSLITVQRADGAVRFRLLEPLRQHAAARLAAAADAAHVHARHAAHFLGRAADLAQPVEDGHPAALDEVHHHMPSYHAAFEWGQAHDPHATLDALADLYGYWVIRAAAGAAAEHLQRIPHEHHARAVWLDGVLSYSRAEQDFTRHFHAAMQLAEAAGDHRTLIDSLHWHGMSLYLNTDPAPGEAPLRRGLALAHQLGDQRRIAWLSANLGGCLQALGREADGQAMMDDALQRFDTLDHRWGRTTTRSTIATLEPDSPPEDVARVTDTILAARQEAEDIGYLWGFTYNCGQLITLAIEQGDHGWATSLVDTTWSSADRLQHLREWKPTLLAHRARIAVLADNLSEATSTLAQAIDTFDNALLVNEIDFDEIFYTTAEVMAHAGQHELAATFCALGTTYAHPASIRTGLGGRRTIAALETRLRSELGNARFDEMFDAAAQMSRDESLDALRACATRPPG